MPAWEKTFPASYAKTHGDLTVALNFYAFQPANLNKDGIYIVFLPRSTTQPLPTEIRFIFTSRTNSEAETLTVQPLRALAGDLSTRPVVTPILKYNKSCKPEWDYFIAEETQGDGDGSRSGDGEYMKPEAFLLMVMVKEADGAAKSCYDVPIEEVDMEVWMRAVGESRVAGGEKEGDGQKSKGVIGEMVTLDELLLRNSRAVEYFKDVGKWWKGVKVWKKIGEAFETGE